MSPVVTDNCKYRVALQVQDRSGVYPTQHTVVAANEETARSMACGTAILLGQRVLGVVSVDMVH